MHRAFPTLALLVSTTALVAQQPSTPPVPQAPQAQVRPSTADTSPFRQLEIAPPNAFRSASGMPGPL
ncbi:MAG TPA: hypothetical protein VF454_02620, partial [Gemmatimonadales bacterium]